MYATHARVARPLWRVSILAAAVRLCLPLQLVLGRADQSLSCPYVYINPLYLHMWCSHAYPHSLSHHTLLRAHQQIGMHFMNPVPIMALVELAKGLHTSQQTFEACKGLAEYLGKQVATSQDRPVSGLSGSAAFNSRSWQRLRRRGPSGFVKPAQQQSVVRVYASHVVDIVAHLWVLPVRVRNHAVVCTTLL